MLRLIFLLAMLFVISVHDAVAETAGRTPVIDGDTIEIRGQRIRLYGIDSPESAQLCKANQKTYRCGQQAALALADRIGERTVRCQERDRDRYGRTVAVCYAGGEDRDRCMVRKEWAMAFRKYSLDYIDAENDARRGQMRHLAGRVRNAVGLASGASQPLTRRVGVDVTESRRVPSRACPGPFQTRPRC
jgi:endonuclease YncB( thermonuclease family)